MDKSRFLQQLDFIYEMDKVKHIVRKTKLFDGSRLENDAEHSWTICLMAVLFREYSNEQIDIGKVLMMLLIHDIVEIDAGDTFLYAPDRETAHWKEQAAAERIFGILPEEQSKGFLAAWEEFEARVTTEAKFASVFDRLEPVLQNYKNGGETWKKNGITKQMVLEKNKHLGEGSVEIWYFFLELIDMCVQKGYLEDR